MTDLITAVGLILVIEGALYALFPQAMKQLVLKVVYLPLGTLRTAGLAAALVGFTIVWLVRGWSAGAF